MHTSYSRSPLRLSLLGLLVLLGLGSQAEAQRVVQKAAKPGAVVAKTAKLNTTAFHPASVGTSLKTSLRGKQVMVAPKAKVGEYAKAMQNSVEIMFQPNASSYGHILVRVGGRMYDMPGPSGARRQNFTDAMRWVNSHAYGFVYARTPAQIETLQREFEAMANAGHGFSIAGTGPTKFSCAGFITAALRDHAPDLKVGLSAGAISAARQLLRSGSHDAVTLYGSAAGEAGKADFQFLKLQ